MKKKFILTPIIGALICLSLSSHKYGPGSGIFGSNIEGTGASGAPGCSCHNPVSTSTTAVTVQLLSGGTTVTSYIPGNSYTVRIHGVNNSGSSLPYFGFQLAVVKASGAGTSSAVSAGSLSGALGPYTHTVTVAGTSVTVFEHYNSTGGDGAIPATAGGGVTGSTYDTSITWTAPSAGTGSVVIYGVENLVNHDGLAGSPDQWNTATAVTICESPSPITGTAVVCAGATTTLSDATTGGTWSSGSSGIATVGTSGVVTGVSGGTAVISYTTSCATVTTTVTVNAVTPGNFIAAGGPTANVCVGSSSLVLSNINPGGSWSSAVTGTATVVSGTVTGVASGTTLISYTLPSTGCAATTTVTVNPLPATISGTLSLCQGGTTTLSGPTGGAWSSGSTAIATVGSSSGIVSGIVTGSTSPATAVITYTTASGCTRSVIVTVNPLPAAITGTATVCQGSTTTLNDATSGGTWSSVSTGVATIVSSGTTGTVTGVSGGTSVISYTLSGTGCAITALATVNPSPSPIGTTGSFVICPTSTTTLTDATPSGTWSSVTPGVATIGTSGIVTGVSNGTSLISYTLPGTGCAATATVTVNPLPAAIGGSGSVCVSSSITLSDTSPGGTWSSADATVSVAGSTGSVTGISSGPATITYATGTGCFVTAPVTVNPLPTVALITGTTNVCVGLTTTLADATGSGVWSSSGSGIASVGSTGVVTGTAVGNATISYTVTSGLGCSNSATAPVTVNPLPSLFNVTGGGSYCSGGTGFHIGLSGSVSGVSYQLLNGGTGVGLLPGTGSPLDFGVFTAAGTYTVIATSAAGCTATMTGSATVSVNPLPAGITGTRTVCVGSTTSLSSSTTGGSWTSSDISRATVGSGSGIVTGVLSGGTSPTITYTLPVTGCATTAVVTVNPIPAAITGTMNVCAGATRVLSDASAGGTWTSSATGTATVTPSGTATTVTGVAGGTATISYSFGTGCSRTALFTVNPLPLAFTITGGGGYCAGGTGVDISLSGSETGVNYQLFRGVTAVGPTAPGTGASLDYSLFTTAGTYTIVATNTTTGCSVTMTGSVTVSINPLPAAIGGATAVCTGASTTLTDASLGGAWTSGSPGTATIGSAGSVTGVLAGTTVITYTLPTTCFITRTETVNTTPLAISGAASVCVGQTISLTDAPTGGSWTSSSTGLATVGSVTGIVTGIAPGTPTITYTLAGCTATKIITVNPLGPVSGLSSLCGGATTTLTDAATGGTWSSVNTAVATIGSASGLVTSIATGTTTISYSLPTGCLATTTFTVISTPSPITGSNQVCVGFTTPLTDAGGGAWTSSNTAVARVGTSGILTGVTIGTATITYSLGSGCTVTYPITVNPLPAAIGGTSSVVCVGSNITLTDAPGGTWSSSNGNASVGSSSGVVTGVAGGASVITYTSSVGCIAVKSITVNALPALISGASTVCISSATTLTDGTSGGTWTSSLPATATVGGGTGIVTGIAAGPVTITYTLSGTGCLTTNPMTVNSLPAVITGTMNVCAGATTTLSDGSGIGSWSATPGTIATVGSLSGIVSGIAAGVATVTFTLPATSCTRTALVTVNALPVLPAITGTTTVCLGATTSLFDGTAGGAWSSGSPSIATIGTTGIVSGISVGTAPITYTFTSTAGCTSAVNTTVTVSPLPSLISGTASMCAGLTTTLTDPTGGGAWSSSPTTIATVGSTGIVTGVSAGTAIVTYAAPVTGCTVTDIVTVNPLPLAIGGTTHVCLGSTTTLTDVSTGGNWSSSAITTADVGTSTGIVTGLLVGAATVTYTLPTTCLITAPVTVNPLPFAGTITGLSSVCATVTIPLADVTAGGVWSSTNTSLATVGSTGIVTGIAAGTDSIVYAVTNICGTATAVQVVTVNPQPVAGTITGLSLVCIGTPVTLTDPAVGGAWSSSNTAIASVGAATGVVAGATTGTATISYSVTNICGTANATLIVSVDPQPVAGTITGADSVCEGDAITLSDAATGGIWSAGNGNATVGTAGTVSGVTAGTDVITYSVTNSCGTATATLPIIIRTYADCHVKVQQIAAAAGFSVYPNPSDGSFTVEIPQPVSSATITIVDVLGKTIETKYVEGANAWKTIFNLNNIVPGNYFVNVHAGDNTYRAKIVIW